jgi:predicted dehydrogenase
VTERIRLGLIGCGSIATKRHLPGLANLKKAGLDTFDVTAVCDAVEANREGAAAYVRSTLGTEPASYASWEELVSDRTVDAVDICLPHGLHHVVGVACLEAGMHVLIEKPLAVAEALYESSWSGQAVRPADLLSGETPSLWQRDIDEYWDEHAGRA